MHPAAEAHHTLPWLERIGYRAFSGCSSLSYIEMGDSENVEIGEMAFFCCTALQSLLVRGGSIGQNAFGSCTSLSSLTLLDGVTYIGYGAFSECPALTYVEIPGSVHTVEDNAFGCEREESSLRTVVIGDGVRVIGQNAFRGAKLSSVHIPASVRDLSYRTDEFGQMHGALSGFTELEAITVDEGNTTFSSVDGMLLGDGGTVMLQYPCGSPSTECRVPEGVVRIESSAFAEFDGYSNISPIQSLILPSALTSFDLGGLLYRNNFASVEVDEGNPTLASFDGVLFTRDMDGLLIYPAGREGTSYDVPASVTSIGENAFIRSKLEEVSLPSGLKTIDRSAFFYCDSLRELELPEGLEVIGDDAFAYCTALTSINIPGSVRSIGSNAFVWCDSLTSPIVLPDGLERIEPYTFWGCMALPSVSIPASVREIGESAFGNCSAMGTVKLPDGLETIGSAAFYFMEGLRTIDIQANVWSIGCNAFGHDYNLEAINVHAANPPIVALDENNGNEAYLCEAEACARIVLNVPVGSGDAYRAAAGWRDFMHINEVEFSGIGDVTNDDVQVFAHDGVISIVGGDGSEEVEVYDAAGILVGKCRGAGVPVGGHGIYMVKVGGTVHKVAM